jgi:aspartate aminotransferase
LDIKLADRIKRVKPSPTLAVTARANALKAEGKDIIGLGAGEPDFDTPEHIKQAARVAIEQGMTKYTPVDGTRELKQAIINKFERENGLSYAPEQILVSCGGKQSFYNLCQALLNPGDEVIIPAPYWVSYPDIVLLAGGEPVIVRGSMDQGFNITPEQLEAAITDKTRLVVINSPSNPTGRSYNRAELSSLAESLSQHPNLIIATDDMYEHIMWTEESFHNILNVCPNLYERTVVMNGVSKAYSMTGWRIGYAGGPAELIAAMKKVQSQSTSNPASISQAAATEALNGDQSCIQEMLAEFKKRHDMVVSRLQDMDGVLCLPSTGTFYSFPSFQEVIEKSDQFDTDVEMAEYLLENAGVALVPGSAFGAPGHMRLSFATSMDVLTEALDRIQQALDI